MRRIGALAVAVLVGLAGCSKPSTSDGPSASAETSPPSTTDPVPTSEPCSSTDSCSEPAVPLEIYLNDCLGLVSNIIVQTDRVRPLVPAGYTLSELTPVATLAGLEWHLCDSVVIDNETVGRQVTFAQVQVPVGPPPEVEAPDNNLYSPELVVSDAATFAWLAQAGMAPVYGNVTQTVTANQYMGTLRGADFEYTITSAGDADPDGLSFTTPYRLHHAAGTEYSWLNVTERGPRAQFGVYGPVQATGGTLGDIAGGAPVLVTGQPQIHINFVVHRTPPKDS